MNYFDLGASLAIKLASEPSDKAKIIGALSGAGAGALGAYGIGRLVKMFKPEWQLPASLIAAAFTVPSVGAAGYLSPKRGVEALGASGGAMAGGALGRELVSNPLGAWALGVGGSMAGRAGGSAVGNTLGEAIEENLE